MKKRLTSWTPPIFGWRYELHWEHWETEGMGNWSRASNWLRGPSPSVEIIGVTGRRMPDRWTIAVCVPDLITIVEEAKTLITAVSGIQRKVSNLGFLCADIVNGYTTWPRSHIPHMNRYVRRKGVKGAKSVKEILEELSTR